MLPVLQQKIRDFHACKLIFDLISIYSLEEGIMRNELYPQRGFISIFISNMLACEIIILISISGDCIRGTRI